MKIKLLFLFFLSGCNVFGQTSWLEIEADSLLRAKEIPGIALAVVQPDCIKYTVKGINKIREGTPLEAHHFFHLGSNTKAFTALFAAQLSARGVVDMDDRLTDLLEDKAGILEAYRDVTLYELLTHQAGVRAYTSGIEMFDLPVMKGTVAERREQFVNFLLTQTPVEKGTYSNAGYAAAAFMLEKASGQSFEELLETFMKEMGWKYAIGWPNLVGEDQPWGHMEMGGKAIATPPDHPYKLLDILFPAGDLAMPIADYAEFIQGVLQGALGQPSALGNLDFQTLLFGRKGYSLGWGNQNDIAFHDGSAGTFYCHVMLDPENKIGFIAIINSAQPSHVEAIYQVRKNMLIKHTENSR